MLEKEMKENRNGNGPLLTSSIHESRRLHPGVDHTYLEALVDFELKTKTGSVLIKKGTTICANHLYANRDKQFFGSNSQDFHPKRFYYERAEARGLVVTGGGPDILPVDVHDRRCPAQELGVEFVKAVLRVATEGWKWTFHVPQPTWDFSTWNVGWHPEPMSFRLKRFEKNVGQDLEDEDEISRPAY